jgi:hypothetical protein
MNMGTDKSKEAEIIQAIKNGTTQVGLDIAYIKLLKLMKAKAQTQKHIRHPPTGIKPRKCD